MSKNRNPSYRGGSRRQQTLLKSPRIAKFLRQVLQMHSVAPIQSLEVETSLYQTEQHATVEWLLKKIECIFPNCLDELCIDLMDAAGHEYDAQFRIEGLQLFHQLESVHLGHLNI